MTAQNPKKVNCCVELLPPSAEETARRSIPGDEGDPQGHQRPGAEPDDINDPTRILNITILNLQAGLGITDYPKGAGASEVLRLGRSEK
ncbi:MAG: hypothetical protein MZV70_44880 [Desulfobacterales bacterium]|nr:hypothetical protein [Desulfobacterales bacterium]